MQLIKKKKKNHWINVKKQNPTFWPTLRVLNLFLFYSIYFLFVLILSFFFLENTFFYFKIYFNFSFFNIVLKKFLWWIFTLVCSKCLDQ